MLVNYNNKHVHWKIHHNSIISHETQKEFHRNVLLPDVDVIPLVLVLDVDVIPLVLVLVLDVDVIPLVLVLDIVLDVDIILGIATRQKFNTFSKSFSRPK